MSEFKDMLAPPPVQLKTDPAAHLPQPLGMKEAIIFPESPLVWANLAEQALNNTTTDEQKVHAYALSRTGYHRGLDRLRGGGWKGFGPVPWSHEPNQGVLRAIAALARAAHNIGEDDEYDRCRALLSDCDPECVSLLLDIPGQDN